MKLIERTPMLPRAMYKAVIKPKGLVIKDIIFFVYRIISHVSS